MQDVQQVVVTAAQMRQIEGRMFAAGMPVAALMEKVAGRITHRIAQLYPQATHPRVQVLVGPGHNGGDALVVARELHSQGYRVTTVFATAQQKELTAQHARYCHSLGIPARLWEEGTATDFLAEMGRCDLWIDGLFGFGLERSLSDHLATLVTHLNHATTTIVSIDLPSGLHTDTGAVLGAAVRATLTLCLGLWKQGLLQDAALDYVGQAELIEFDIPLADIVAVVGEVPLVQRITPAIAQFPHQRPAASHKYQMGHLLLVCGSRRYPGAAILAAWAARATGVGLLTIAVPASLRSGVVAQIPDALVVGCPETEPETGPEMEPETRLDMEAGAIAHLPTDLDLSHYSAIACGPGLTRAAIAAVQAVLASDRPLILDADALNSLAPLGHLHRPAPTLLTPHLGEFRRLFPDLEQPCRIQMAQRAAQRSGAIVLLKGARVAIAQPNGQTWLNPTSTPALARGGTGDVLTGLLGGLLAQRTPLPSIAAQTMAAQTMAAQTIAAQTIAATATLWHAHAALLAAQTHTLMGVDATTLVQYLNPALVHLLDANG
jgi:ADP-dependent NAD(P)H-hydrate dehydratase / NAD(P)H-hydrate epimerase